MVKLNKTYITYYIIMLKNFTPLFTLNNVLVLKYSDILQKVSFTKLFKSNIWLYNILFSLEKEIIVLYFTKIYNKEIKLLNNHVILETYSTYNIVFKRLNKNLQILIKNTSNYIYNIFYTIKWVLIAFIISFFYFFFSLFYLQLDITKQLSIWFILLIVFYLLMSTFNNFLNKYKYGKFTSSIQRFWKRTGMTFWLIEGFLFLIFFYYFLNSSQEPLYMYDYSNLNQELLIQLKVSFKNNLLLSLIILICFIIIVKNNYLNYFQNIVLLASVSLIIFYMLYIESYQFVNIISLFSDKNWIFEETTQIWILEFEQNNLRTKQQYFILCLIAKYWHFIFIFISWFFFVIKCFEINKINYTLLSYNVQNLLILYVLNTFCLIQWAKYVFKKFLELTYYWFHIQYDEKFLTLIINEVIVTMYSFFNISNFININNNFQYNIISTSLFCSDSLSLWKFIICLK